MMVVATFLALALVLLCLTSLLRALPPARALADLGDREPQIDGLRGICALLVAAHHAVFVLELVDNHAWRIVPADHVLQTMGKSAVAFFFMICAYLFWGKLARGEGRQGLRYFAGFIRNRLARLLPAYLFAMIFIMIFIGLAPTGFRLSQGYAATIGQALQALTFSFFGTPHFNGSFLASAAIYVSWSLYYEWLFYFALPFVRLFRLRHIWAFALPALIVMNVTALHFAWVEYFAYGAAAFELSRRQVLRPLLASPLGSLASIALFVGVNVVFTEDGLETGLAPALLALSFVPIAAGASWGGLLSGKAPRFIGAVSYSLYLLNTPVLLLIARFVYPSTHGVVAVTAAETIYILAALGVSVMAYHLVERPFLRLGPRPAKDGRELAPLAGPAPQPAGLV